ncbi:hypothetical protein [Bifidobacterium simiarum]|uniref:hypothetical protein n=1 Tax=Bifidobacterium simiarum TaxID=2045441 RepID=UPI001BDBFF67|nr:hypothetical protein [Bifidobacterium simiarum]MBT1165419.1 hypothetical protein [Bifidobacterium simiarum]
MKNAHCRFSGSVAWILVTEWKNAVSLISAAGSSVTERWETLTDASVPRNRVTERDDRNSPHSVPGDVVLRNMKTAKSCGSVSPMHGKSCHGMMKWRYWRFRAGKSWHGIPVVVMFSFNAKNRTGSWCFGGVSVD